LLRFTQRAVLDPLRAQADAPLRSDGPAHRAGRRRFRHVPHRDLVHGTWHRRATALAICRDAHGDGCTTDVDGIHWRVPDLPGRKTSIRESPTDSGARLRARSEVDV